VSAKPYTAEVRKFKAIWGIGPLLRRYSSPSLIWLELNTGAELKEVAGIVPQHITDTLTIKVERESNEEQS